MTSAGSLFAATAFTGAVAVVVFDWSLADVLAGGAVGVVVWGACSYLLEIRTVDRWQRAHGGEVPIRYEGGDYPELHMSR